METTSTHPLTTGEVAVRAGVDLQSVRYFESEKTLRRFTPKAEDS